MNCIVRREKITNLRVKLDPVGVFNSCTTAPCLYKVMSCTKRDVNVFIFFEKRSFRYEKDDKKSKTKRSLLKTIVFQKSFFIKLVVSLTIEDDPSVTIVNDDHSLTIFNDRFY